MTKASQSLQLHKEVLCCQCESTKYSENYPIGYLLGIFCSVNRKNLSSANQILCLVFFSPIKRSLVPETSNTRIYSKTSTHVSCFVVISTRLATSLFPKSPRQTHSTARNLSAEPSKKGGEIDLLEPLS